jgi:thiaminase
MTDKLTVKQLEELAHELYEKWVETRADEDYKAWEAVKERLDALREENWQ